MQIDEVTAQRIEDKVFKKIKSLRTNVGVTTCAEFFQDITFDARINWNQLCNEAVAAGDRWFCSNSPSQPFNYPPAKTGEKDSNDAQGTQTFVTKCLQQIFEIQNKNYFKRGSDDLLTVPKFHYSTDFFAFKHPSFLNRRPDVVFHRNSRAGELAIIFFGDVKPAGEADFTDEQKGHILDMAIDFMTKVQIDRTHLFCFLTDGKRFQFFRVTREDNDSFVFSQSEVLLEHIGWQVSAHDYDHNVL